MNTRKLHRDIKAWKLHRAFGILLAAALVFQTVPFEGIAVSASESSGGGLCEHHRSHTPDCGYKEAEPGHGCTHEHTEDCYRTVEGEDGSTTREPDCHHEHDESCGYREAAEGSPCTFVCEICNGRTDGTPEDNTEDNEINDGESENPGTENGNETEEPDDGQEECTCEERCTEDSINTDCPVCGAEDASLSDCKGEDAEENTDQPEDTGLCKHHREHDDACGYLPESEDSEGSSCTYECRICPIEKLIAALPDAEDITEDNADDVRAQLDEILALYRELTEDEQEQIDLSRCYELQKALDKTNAPMLAEVSVAYREADWNGSEVVYTDKSADCTPVENSTEVIKWTEGWYVVSNTVTISEPITVNGAVNLILADGCTLTASKGIVVTTGNSLTIYAQSDGTGTLNATGTTDSDNNASAGIGGGTSSLDSGSITIHGGVINAAGGYVNNMGGSGAGIGGGGSPDGNGGDSGAITIYNGVITAVGGELDYDKQIAAYFSGAGIGGGSSRNNNGGAGSSITIYGGDVTATSKAANNGGAGIGGGAGAHNGGSGNITIRGGTVRATGGCIDMGMGGAGVGGGGSIDRGSGDGTVAISGGSVTAVGGRYAAGIGGGSGYQSSSSFGDNSVAGGIGSVTITGGIVDASSPTNVPWEGYEGAPIGNGGNASGTATVNKTTAIVFENGVGTVCGNVTFDGSYNVPAGYSLHIPTGASLSGSGTLSGGGTFTTELSEDMISVPADLYYNGQDRTEEIAGKVAIDGGITLCGQTFTVSGWTVEVEKTDDLHYTATYTNDSDTTKTFTKTITLQKSGTQFVGGGTVKTYKGSAECSNFTASDTITVKATPTATGAASVKAAVRLRGDPTAGQMVVLVNDKQVSTPADKGADGSYTMTVSAADVLTLGGVEPNQAITLTAKFVGNDNMADAYGTVDVKISAVAKVVKGGTTTYIGNLDGAFKAENDGAIITLLDNVEITKSININAGNLTLDLNGKKISLDAAAPFYTSLNVINTLTIKDSSTDQTGTCEAMIDISGINATLTLNGGNFSSSLYAVRLNTGRLFVGSGVRIYGDAPYGVGLKLNDNKEVNLSGGTFSCSGGGAAIQIGDQTFIPPLTATLGDLLGHSGGTRYAYFDESGAPIIGKLEEQMLTGTVTVQECKHTGDGVCEYTHAKGTTTHQQTCLACGKIETEETCSYADGKCVCGSTLSVALTDTEKLVYDGNSHEPGVTVTLDGTELTAADYDITYVNNINAGMDTATVTVKGKGNYSFEIEKTFSIEKAEQEDFAVMAVTKQYEKNGTFPLSTTGGGGDGAVLYRVPENNGVLMVKGNTATIIGVGTVTVTATKAESDNYKEAAATGIITIKKASAPAITYPTAGSITYGQKLSDCALIGGSTEYGTFAWKDDSTVPAVGNTTGYAVVFTASEETEKNYESITDTTQKVSVKVEQAVPAVSIVAALSGSKDSRQAVLTVNVAKAGAGAFPTGTVKLIDCTGSTEREIGTVTLNNSGTASYTWDGLQDKAYTIKAVYTGDSNYKEAVSREFTFDAAKQNQKDFSLEAIGAKTYGDTAIPLKTTGGSGSGAVSYKSSDENVIRIEDGRAVIVGAGTATITAIKEGDDNYNEASAGRNVTVAKKALTVKADSKTVVRGNPMPVFTYRADGLVNGDTFTTAPSITAGAQDTDTLGKYDIVIGGGTLRNSGSYRITYVNGTLHIVERIYTVIVTDGTGGGEYAEGDTVTITANERNGYTFTGWSSGDGVAFADGKAKTTTFTMPAKSVTVKANYTRNSSGGNNGGGSGDGGNSGGSGNNSGGGNTGDNGNNGGQGSGGGGSTNPGNGNTTPQVSVLQPADTKTNTNPGNEATPGTGTKQPFIKGEDGKIGWDVIRIEEEQAQEGSTINVDMNGSTVVPGDIFDSIKGKDITITFDMGNGILWSVDGKNITTDKAGDIDFSVKTGVKTVPVDIINNVTGESYSIQLSLAYEGEFGFTAVLSIELGQENAGYTASLYYYNESTGELAFVCADTVAQDGTVSLAFTHASDYVIAIDAEAKEENDTAEAVQTEGTDATAGTDESAVSVPEGLEAGQTGKIWRGILTIVLVTAIGIGAVLVIRKKRE